MSLTRMVLMTRMYPQVVKIIKATVKAKGLQDVFIATDGTLGRGHGAHSDMEYIQKRMLLQRNPRREQVGPVLCACLCGRFHEVLRGSLEIPHACCIPYTPWKHVVDSD